VYQDKARDVKERLLAATIILSANGQNLKVRSRRSKKQQQSLTPGLTFQNNVQINVKELSDG
jgi:hypothetical protein